MGKDQIILQLRQENSQLRKQLQLWKRKYCMIEQAYEQLLNGGKSSLMYFADNKKEEEDVSAINFQTSTTSRKQQITLQEDYDENQKIELPHIINIEQKLGSQFKSKTEQIKAPVQTENIQKNECLLFEGCFVMQKISNNSKNNFRFIYPQELSAVKMKTTFDIIYDYVFQDEQIYQILDDQLDSRKNQILYGAIHEHFTYSFDCFEDNIGKNQDLSVFQKKNHLLRKRYVFGLIKSQIIVVDKKNYETELCYGFITSVLFPLFFKDVNLTVLQQIKLSLLNSKLYQKQKQTNFTIISKIVKDIVIKSNQKKLTIQDFPINIQLQTNICNLRLQYQNQESYCKQQLSSVNALINKFSVAKLIKLLHYVLAEKHTVIVCKNRKSLNECFEIIRVLLNPFVWVFPIVYSYSPYFQPFLNSPLPLLVGYIQNNNQQYQSLLVCFNKIQKALPKNEYVMIYADDAELEDQRQLPELNQRIKQCCKLISKIKQNRKKESAFIKQQLEETVAYKIFIYVQKLRKYIETGIIDQRKDEFLQYFPQTQMVTYYKDGLGKKECLQKE